MKSNDLGLPIEAPAASPGVEPPGVGLADLLTWLGEGKRLIGTVTIVAGIAALIYALTLPFVYTARTSLLAPNSQTS